MVFQNGKICHAAATVSDSQPLGQKRSNQTATNAIRYSAYDDALALVRCPQSWRPGVGDVPKIGNLPKICQPPR
jgi:hypothetical protein